MPMNDKTRKNQLGEMRCKAICLTVWAALALWSIPCAAQLSTTEQLQQLQARYDEMVGGFITQVRRLPDAPELFDSLPAKAESLVSGELLKLTDELAEAKKVIGSREIQINQSGLSVQDKNELKAALAAQKKPLDSLATKVAGFKTALSELKDKKLKEWKQVYNSFLSISGPEKARERLRSSVSEFCKPYTTPKTSSADTPAPSTSPAKTVFAPTPSPAGPAPPQTLGEDDGSDSTGWVNTIAQKAAEFLGASTPPQPPRGSKVLRFDEALRRADQGDAYAQAVVSIYYSLGYLTNRDASKAYQYARRSAEQDDPLGIYRLGVILERGEGVAALPEEGARLKGMAFDRLKAMSGDPYALTALGVMTLRGENTRRNETEAARLYKLAADLGYAPAQYNYSACCIAGRGIPKNPAWADKYWRMAYEQGYPPALEGPPR